MEPKNAAKRSGRLTSSRSEHRPEINCAWFLYRRLRLFWRQRAWLALRSPFLMAVFARCPRAATRSPLLMIVRSILGTNALHPRAVWAAGAPQIHGGTDLDSS